MMITTNAGEAYLKLQNDKESNAQSYPRHFPLVIDRAKGLMVTDTEGKQYYDCLSGAGTLALGHNHDVVVAAIKDVLAKQIPLHTLDLATPLKLAFMQEIFSILPEPLRNTSKIQFCGPTGADGVEAAIKLVKNATKGKSILAFQGGYHGSTQATMAMSGNLSKKQHLQSLLPDVHFLPFPYEYRCPFGVGEGMTAQISAQYIENLLDDCESGIAAPCCMIIETVQGEGGAIPAYIEWLREVAPHYGGKRHSINRGRGSNGDRKNRCHVLVRACRHHSGRHCMFESDRRQLADVGRDLQRRIGSMETRRAYGNVPRESTGHGHGACDTKIHSRKRRARECA